jgi:hypothetical protein
VPAIQEDIMKPTSSAFIPATLTALVTIAAIALLFLFPGLSQNTNGPDIGLRTQTSNIPSPKATTKGDADISQVLTRTGANLTSLMNLERMGTIITRLDEKAELPRKGFWRFTITGASVIAVADDTYDRLRILVGIQSAKELTQDQLMKITRSNFDTALDARYAISQDILWAIYVHPLKSLSDQQFISAIGQTVNLAKSYGDGYSSGGILFDGGDDKDSLRNQMIEQLIAKGLGS